MAKFEGVQNIPSELLDLYRGALNPNPIGFIVKKRYPYRMPKMQEGGVGVSAAQVTQRNRFKAAQEMFKKVTSAERARWFAAEPPWSSFLWYYNYFIKSALTGNADVTFGGAGVIKKIQVVSKSIPTIGNENIVITVVDPAKTVVLLNGCSYISDLIHHYSGIIDDNTVVQINLSPSIVPAISEVKVTGAGGFMDLVSGTGTGRWGDFFITEIAATYIKLKLQDLASAGTFGYVLEIIEHKSQTIYPYVKAIAAEAITIDWPVTPSVAAIIGATVIEYI